MDLKEALLHFIFRHQYDLFGTSLKKSLEFLRLYLSYLSATNELLVSFNDQVICHIMSYNSYLIKPVVMVQSFNHGGTFPCRPEALEKWSE